MNKTNQNLLTILLLVILGAGAFYGWRQTNCTYENGVLVCGGAPANATTTPQATATNAPGTNEIIATLTQDATNPGSEKEQVWLGAIDQAGISSNTTEFATLFSQSLQTVPASAIEASRSNIQADVIYCDGQLSEQANLANTSFSRLDKAELVITSLKNPLKNYAYSGQQTNSWKLWYEFNKGVLGCYRKVEVATLVAGVNGYDFFGPVGTTFSVPDAGGNPVTYTNITITPDNLDENAFTQAQTTIKLGLEALGATNFQIDPQDPYGKRLIFSITDSPEFRQFIGDCQLNNTCQASLDEANHIIYITPLVPAGNITVTMNLRVGMSLTTTIGNERVEKITTSRSWINWDDKPIETALVNGVNTKSDYVMVMQPNANGVRPLDAVQKEFVSLLTSSSGNPGSPSFYDLMATPRWQETWTQMARQAGFTGTVHLVINPIFPREQWVYLDSIDSGVYTPFTPDACALKNDLSYIKSLVDPERMSETGFVSDWIWQDMVAAGCFQTNLR